MVRHIVDDNWLGTGQPRAASQGPNLPFLPPQLATRAARARFRLQVKLQSKYFLFSTKKLLQQLQLPIQLHCIAKWLKLIFVAKKPFRALSFLLSSTTSSMLKRAFANVPIISVCAHKPYVHHYVPLCTTMCTTLSPRSVLGESWTARYRGDWPMLSLSSNQNFAPSSFF